MGKVILDISMSLDGYIAGCDDNQNQPLGIGGEKLHEWLFSGEFTSKHNEYFNMTKEDREIFDQSIDATGAMIVGRRTFDIVNGWGGNHPAKGVPVFVVTHRAPKDYPIGSTPFYFITDGVESAVKQAKAVAGDKNVSVGTASVAQQCIHAGILDEMHLHVAPVLLGSGVRVFDCINKRNIELENTIISKSNNVTHLFYQIKK